MLDARTLQMLKSSRAEDREKAIKALAQSKDPAALPYLANVYRNDPEAALREMARKAGVYIRKNSEGAFHTRLPDAPYAQDRYGGGADDDAPPVIDATAPKPKTRPITDAQRAQARGYLNQALDASLAGDRKRAYQLLQKGVKIDPNLGQDTYTRNAISNITGLPYERAMAELATGGLARNVAGPADEITWGDAFVDLAIYWVINFGIFLIGTLIGLASLQAIINTIPDPIDQANIGQQFALITNTFTLVFMLTQGAIQATIAVVVLLIVYFMWHMVATAMLGGEGRFTTLIRKCTLLLALYGPVSTLLVMGATLFLPLLSPSNSTVWYALLTLGIAVGGVLLLSQRIGATYAFGMGRGCATIIVSYVLIACLLFSFFYIWFSSTMSTFSLMSIEL